MKCNAVFIIGLMLFIAGCASAQEKKAEQVMNLNITQSGEGTEESPKNIKMKISTPDGDAGFIMRMTDQSFSLVIVTPKEKK